MADTTSAHTVTPGPWVPSARTFRTHTHSGRAWERSIATSDGVIVATAFGSTPEEAEANAERIAALPSLLQELRETALALPNHSPDCQGQRVAGAACCFFAERHLNIRAALSRAENS